MSKIQETAREKFERLDVELKELFAQSKENDKKFDPDTIMKSAGSNPTDAEWAKVVEIIDEHKKTMEQLSEKIINKSRELQEAFKAMKKEETK